jgi:hypothetical protein
MRPEVCPVCGAEVPPKARVCPGCGADETTGWSEEAAAQGLDLPEPAEEFDYDDFVKRELDGSGTKPRGIPWFWWIVAVLILVLFGYGMLRRFF